MKLTKNFHSNEFACKDGSETPCEALVNLKELAMNLQVLRDEIGKPISVNSGYRSPEWNRRVGGAKNSYHIKGMAADIVVGGMTPKEVAAKIAYLIDQGKMKEGGLVAYNTFTHYDTRGNRTTWRP